MTIIEKITYKTIEKIHNASPNLKSLYSKLVSAPQFTEIYLFCLSNTFYLSYTVRFVFKAY